MHRTVAARLHAGAAERRRRSGRAAEAGLAHGAVHHAVRVGLRYVRGLSDALLDRIDAERGVQPFADLEDFTRRTAAPVDAVESLPPQVRSRASTSRVATRCGPRARCATRGRSSARAGGAHAPGVVTGVEAPPLPGMTEVEETAADLWSLGLSPGRHPTEFVRDRLDGARRDHRRRAAPLPIARWWRWAAWSRTASSLRPRTAWCSSTSRTRPAL